MIGYKGTIRQNVPRTYPSARGRRKTGRTERIAES